MENDPNKKESKGKRILKKALRRNSKSNNSSQHSAIEQSITDSKSKNYEEKCISIEVNQSALLTKSDGTNEKLHQESVVHKIKLDNRIQIEKSQPLENGHGKTRLYKVDETKDESPQEDSLPIDKDVKLNTPTNASNERSRLDSSKNILKRVCFVAVLIY